MKNIGLKHFFAITCLLLIVSVSATGQGLSEKQIDSLVKKTMTTFSVPGMAVAVIKDGKIFHAAGYGTRSVEKGGKVDKNTLFAIASNTKAFTTASLAQLIDQGKLKWSTKVREIIPSFTLYNPYVSSAFTVKDLLTHRSGLGLGAGDLMIIPASVTTTKEELIYNLRFLNQASPFRTKFDYDNLLYIVAGEVIERASGMPYSSYVMKNIVEPLGMENTVMKDKIESNPNVIEGHVPIDGGLKIAGPTSSEVSMSAGGLWSSVNDMSKWVLAQLNHGKYGENLNDSLFSEKNHEEMWSPQTIMDVNEPKPYNTHFASYGLGWFLSDVNGYKQIGHTGSWFGIVSQVTLIPELDLGIIVLTNQQSRAAYRAISNSIKDAYFGIEGKNRIKQYNEARLKRKKRAEAIVAKVWAEVEKTQNSKNSTINLERYIGIYKDPWFGKTTISEKNGKLYFEAEKSPDLQGEMTFYKGNTFIVKWNNRIFNADAYVVFRLNKEAEAKGFKMEAVSPLTDFSFDFQDLDFERVRGE